MQRWGIVISAKRCRHCILGYSAYLRLESKNLTRNPFPPWRLWTIQCTLYTEHCVYIFLGLWLRTSRIQQAQNTTKAFLCWSNNALSLPVCLNCAGGIGKRAWASNFSGGIGKRGWNSGFTGNTTPALLYRHADVTVIHPYISNLSFFLLLCCILAYLVSAMIKPWFVLLLCWSTSAYR